MVENVFRFLKVAIKKYESSQVLHSEFYVSENCSIISKMYLNNQNYNSPIQCVMVLIYQCVTSDFFFSFTYLLIVKVCSGNSLHFMNPVVHNINEKYIYIYIYNNIKLTSVLNDKMKMVSVALIPYVGTDCWHLNFVDFDKIFPDLQYQSQVWTDVLLQGNRKVCPTYWCCKSQFSFFHFI